jgi:hypothetical protein
MDKQGLLKNIREQIAARQGVSAEVKKCSLCGHALTIDKTKYFISEVCESCLEHVQIFDLPDCCVNPILHRVRLITSSGTIQVRDQCTNCGNVKGNSIGGYSKEEREKLPLLDENARKKRSADYSEIYISFYRVLNEKRERLRVSRRDQIKENWFKEYNRYLNSPEWRTKRDKVLKRDNYRCQCCLDNYATQVHHKSYEFVDLAGSEPCFDLVSVCTPCHDQIEEMKKKNRESKNL